MARYGVLRISMTVLKEWLCLNGNDEYKRHYRRVTDLPDDTDIENVTYDPSTRTLELLLRGSGPPFPKTAEGAIIPTMTITLQEVVDD